MIFFKLLLVANIQLHLLDGLARVGTGGHRGGFPRAQPVQVLTARGPGPPSQL